ncbi:unnamed protein product [Ilex paraguariensis]|uniref:Uncharacterized protein n=1 Tax=Ilex paraguariensis TaxID=185542 RepID=A0ABC8R6S5_9AQUA
MTRPRGWAKMPCARFMGTAKGEALPSEVTQNLEGEALWALAGGCADHGEGIAVGWAQPGEHAAASPGLTHGLASVLEEGMPGVRHHVGTR